LDYSCRSAGVNCSTENGLIVVECAILDINSRVIQRQNSTAISCIGRISGKVKKAGIGERDGINIQKILLTDESLLFENRIDDFQSSVGYDLDR
jgi:hypothetical protein